MPEADWTLTEDKINSALGGEVRKAREAAGLTRPELVARLPFEVAVATLLNWELGHRGISYVRLAELARTLGESAPELLERALNQAESIQTEYVNIDVVALCDDAKARYVMLRTWGERKRQSLSNGVRIVRLHHSVIREWAVLLNVKLIDLVRYLDKVAALTPVVSSEDSANGSSSNG